MVDVILAKNIRVWVALLVHAMREKDVIYTKRKKKKRRRRRIGKGGKDG